MAWGLLQLGLLITSYYDPSTAYWNHLIRLRAPAQYYLPFLVPGLMVLGGLVMVRGDNLFRWAFILWFGYLYGMQAYHLPRQSILSVCLFLVGAGLLLLPKSNAFFGGRRAQSNEAPKSPAPTSPPASTCATPPGDAKDQAADAG